MTGLLCLFCSFGLDQDCVDENDDQSPYGVKVGWCLLILLFIVYMEYMDICITIYT